MAKKVKRVIRKGQRVSAAEAERLNAIRRKAQHDFPPDPNRPRPVTTGIGARIREARERQGLTWDALAKAAEIPNPSSIRNFEYGRDTKLSSVEAIAAALDLRLDLVEVGR